MALKETGYFHFGVHTSIYKGRMACLLKAIYRVHSLYCDHDRPDFLSHQIIRHSGQGTVPEASCIMIK
jgi:hypothetical protein